MTDNTQLTQELEVLKRRLRVLEDKEAIRDLLVRYAFTADLERIDDFLELWTEDGTYELDSAVWKGRDQIKQGCMSDAFYNSIKNRSQHLILDLIINVNGDSATAAGYSATTVHWQAGFGLGRCALSTFRFRRVKGRWLIEQRVNRQTGDPRCHSLISRDW